MKTEHTEQTTTFDLDITNLPQHIGIIMDGNGRWASQKGKPRTFGHKEGLNAAKRVVKAASEAGIRFVTLYVFSTENWKRATAEVFFLMQLIKKHLKKEYTFYKRNRIRVTHCGDLNALDQDLQHEIWTVEDATSLFSGLTVNLAINYGGRNEIIRSINKWLKQNKNGHEFTENDLNQHLDQSCFPEPDLIIRTAGEQRISNFLLWESAYSELYFSKVLWPDWDKETLYKAIREYQKRTRKFGGIE